MTQNPAEMFAGMTEEQRRAYILALMQTPEFAEVKKDKVAVEKAEKDAKAEAEKRAEEARKQLMSKLFGPVADAVRPMQEDMVKAGLIGLTVSVEVVDGKPTIGIKPVTRVVAPRATAGGAGSGGSASPTSVRSLLGVTPEALFMKHASDEEKEFYQAISPLSSEAYTFKRSIYVPRAVEAGDIPGEKDGESQEMKKARRYNARIAKEWAEKGEAGEFGEGVTFADLRKRAEAVKAERQAK